MNLEGPFTCVFGDFAVVSHTGAMLFATPNTTRQFAELPVSTYVFVLSHQHPKGMRMFHVMTPFGVGWVLPFYIKPLLNAFGEEPIEDEYGVRYDV